MTKNSHVFWCIAIYHENFKNNPPNPDQPNTRIKANNP